MKLLYTFAAVLLFSFANAQIVNIPDATFKEKLLYSNYTAQNAAGVNFVVDINHDGEIQVSEALLVSKLNISNSLINSLEGIQAFANLVELNCDYCWLVNLDVSMLAALKKLSCNSCGLTALSVNGLLQLEELFANNNYLTTLNLTNLPTLKNFECTNNDFQDIDVSNLANLQKLNCYSNHLSDLDLSNLVNLTDVNCGYNTLASINTTNLPNLKNFSIPQNQLSTFDISNLPALEVFDCSANLMNSLNVAGATTLKELHCSGCNLQTLDVSTLTGLTMLYCDGNNLTTLNVANLTNLISLICEFNQLTSINFGNVENLVYLNCNYNSLTTLDLSNVPGLVNLQCRDNNIAAIDVSATPLLVNFFCSGNQLQTLDLSHNSHIDFLDCSNNQLVSIFAKNGKDEQGFNFSGNQTLQFICVDEFQVQGVKQLMNTYSWQEGNFWYADHCALSSYCSFVPGGDYYVLQGNTTIDTDNDGCEVTDTVFPLLNLSITDGLQTGNFIADTSGAYQIPVQAGMHTVTPQLENPAFFTVSPASFQADFPTQASPMMQNFCVTFNGAHQDLEVVVIPLGPARPGFDCRYKITYKNKGTTEESGTISFLFEDAKMDFVSALPAQDNLATNNISWNYSDLQPFETRSIEVVLNANSPSEIPAVNIGDQLNFQATINDVSADETPADNVLGIKQFVVGSLDPNDKTCLEGQVVGPGVAGQYVHYVIRFENTGNFQAENVVVKDYIDTSKYDISSIIPLGSSHSFVTRISYQSLVEFIFEGINLPFDDAANDGYVVFKIKTLPTLTVGQTFSNTAQIFFDYNLPVVTNTATTSIQFLGTDDFDFSSAFVLYPNPVQNTLNIQPKSNIEIKSVEVYNLLGQMVKSGIGNLESVDVSNLKPGVYFLKVFTGNGNTSVKFIKG